MIDYDMDDDDQAKEAKASKKYGNVPEDLAAAAAAEINDAVDYTQETFAEEQARMTDYYKGDLPGVTTEDIDDNRSDIVSRDVHDAFQAIMPDMMRVFLGAEHVVEFTPGNDGDEEFARQATDAIRYIFEKENDAYNFVYGAFKDGLIRRYAVATWYVDEQDKSFEREYSGLSEEEFSLLLDEPDTEVVEFEAETIEPVDPMSPPTNVYTATLRHERKVKRFVVDLVPSEELIVSRRARTAKGDRFVGRRRNMTVDEVVAMGYPRDLVEQYASSDEELRTSEVESARNPAGQEAGPTRQDPGSKDVLYVEGWMPWSIDDKQQLVKVCALGDAHNVVRWETADEINMVVWTPDPEPHTVIGDSWAGKVADIQRMKTEIWRGVLDSLAEALVPRTEVVEGQVNIDDALSNEIGALVRVRQPGMVRPISTPFVGQQALPLLEIADKMKEDRVGAMAASDGLSAEAMQSSTKMAVAATIGGSKAHKELLARGFANNFLKPIFRGLLRLFVENQDKPKTMRLRGKWVPVDPRGWNADMDADVNVALALATNEEKMGFLGLVVQKQEQILQTLGPSNPLVGLDQYAATLRRMVEMAGYRNADQFFKPVDPNWAPPQPQQQQPDPAQQLVAAQTRSIEAELVLKKQKQDADLAAERDRLLMDDDYRRDKMSQDAILALQEMELKYGVQLDTTRAKIAAEQAVKRDQLATNALQQTQPAAAPQMQPPTA